ncbi:hypothetical protein ALC53_00685 [Atta colombica]|uniref:Uncharacterized protein n=1 Tax=Atta colombica TaxID=520822 RepID=A0A195BXS8_9HYME|nr:hypothetical protein ALC53_00685 [Atta colombica]
MNSHVWYKICVSGTKRLVSRLDNRGIKSQNMSKATSVLSRWSKSMIARKYFWIGIKFGTFPWGGPREHGDIPSRLQGLRGD